MLLPAMDMDMTSLLEDMLLSDPTKVDMPLLAMDMDMTF